MAETEAIKVGPSADFALKKFLKIFFKKKIQKGGIHENGSEHRADGK
jgi:hypothetical protein